MKIKRLNEALEDELDILLVASDCRCKLSQYDIEEAADLEQLAQYIKKVYDNIVKQYGNRFFKYWKFAEDGIKIYFANGKVELVDELELTDADNITESIDLSKYEPMSSRVGGYEIYRYVEKDQDGKIVKGHWAAKSDAGEPFEITYEQARGFEPITPVQKLSKDLGKKLLPKSSHNRFNLEEDYTEYSANLEKAVRDFLLEKTLYHDISVNDNVIEIDVHWGDWKHEHLRLDLLMNDFFDTHSDAYELVRRYSEVTEENGTDSYSATHFYEVHFKAPESLYGHI